MANQTAPGPTDREMLGQIRGIQTDPLSFLHRLSNSYGAVACFHVFTTPVFVLSHPEAVKHVLQDEHRRYSKDTIQYNSLASITGRGLLTNDGASWLRQRRLAQPAFSRPRMQSLDLIVVPATQRMLARWEAHARSGEVLDIDAEMMRLTLEIVGKALFSIDLSEEASQLTHAVITTLDHIVYRVRNVVVMPESIPVPRNLRFRRALKLLDTTVQTMINSRRQTGQMGDDLLGMFLQARDEETGQQMSDRQIRDEVMTMLIAGHETVASALTWAWLLLDRHPQEREKLQAEVQSVLTGRLPISADLGALVRTGWVFSEALRLYPPAWVISRKAIEPDQILGYDIPQGALVIISPYVVHRQAEFWPEPEVFRPERFADDPAHRFAYIPFGGGPRLCIGNQFAQVEAQLILAQVLQRFHLELVGEPPAVDALVTLRPVGGLPMRVCG